MTKKEFVGRVSTKLGVPAYQAGQIVDVVFGEVADALAAQERLTVPGFGTFEVRERAARTGRNPQTGQQVEIPATKYPAFKAGQPLKDAVAKR